MTAHTYPTFAVGKRPSRGRPNRLAAALALSLALHALFLFAYRHGVLPRRPAETRPAPASEPLTVRLRAPEPVPVPVPVPVLKPEPEAAAPRPRPVRRAAPRRSPPPVIAIDKDAREAAPDAVEPAPAVPDPAPRFDPDAARQTARRIASEPDPARAGTAVGQIPPKPLATETRLARAIAGAKRRDCKDGLPGGLLGPIIILFDKKDSGCKW